MTDFWVTGGGLVVVETTIVGFVGYDTTKVPADGSLEFRFHAKVTSPDGTLGYTSTGWQAVLANGGGRPIQNYRKPPWIEAATLSPGVHFVYGATGSSSIV